jgi:hypothetical protein
MKANRLAFLTTLTVLITITFLAVSCSSETGKKLTDEQMTALRTRPAVVLIYSGMYAKISLAGKQLDIPYYGTGSGFFINPDGYLLTHGQLVDSYVEYMKDRDSFARRMLDNYITALVVREFTQARGRTPGQREIDNAYRGFVRDKQPAVVSHGPINHVVLSNSEIGNFKVQAFSPSIPDSGRDIAVLKIERDKCPAILLGDSANLALHQPIFAVGFRTAVDPLRLPLPGEEKKATSSITRGTISTLKFDYKGIPVIRLNADTAYQYSGGPVVNSTGRVIGVLSYAGREAGHFRFCIPINTVKEFVQSAGVEYNKHTDFTKILNNLMDSVQEGSWFDAREKVNTSLSYMNNDPGLERLDKMIRGRIDDMGFFEKMWQKNRILVIVASILVVLILVVALTLVKPFAKKEKPEMQPHSEATADEVLAAARGESKPGDEEDAAPESDIAGTVTIVVEGKETGTFAVTSTKMIIGRDPRRATVVINHEIISKKHLKVLPKGDQFFIRDLGSTNGTYVNGEKINETLVTPEDNVELGKRGHVKLIFKK